MKTKLAALAPFALLVVSTAAVAQAVGGPAVMQPETPFNSYTASVIAYALMAAVLFVGLMVGGFLILSLGMFSKRPEDRIGRRTPSDFEILKSVTFPEELEQRAVLPAEETEAGEASGEKHRRDDRSVADLTTRQPGRDRDRVA